MMTNLQSSAQVAKTTQLLSSVARLRLLLVMLLTLSVSAAWGATETITLTQSALELTGSYTTETEKTIDGVTFVYTDLMKNNDNIQAKASSGIIYNKTAIPGNITKITVTHSGTARSTTVCYGTSAQPTENSTQFSGSKEITVSGSNSFFKITRGSNAAYWTEIVITYETSNSSDGDDAGDTNCLTLSASSNYPFNSTSSSNTSVYSTTIDGITLENKGGYKYNSYLSFNKSLSGAYIANTTPFSGNIESIVVDYNSGGSGYFNMYEGGASKPSSTVVSPSKTGTGTVTYTFSGNNPYFKLALKTTGTYCNINSITICYSNTPTLSYTVTATSNNNDYGTVSVSGTTITASPKTGYTYANPAFTVTSGTATVTQNGNTFTVTPSSNCTIRINFVEKVKNTYIDNVQGYSTQTLYDIHSAPSLTDKAQATTGTCEQQHWHFMGWVTEANKENPTDANIVKANTSVTANGTTYYAVWAKGTTTGGGSTSKQYSFDITPSNFNSTSYAANNNEKTSTAKASDGSTLSVKWTSNQVMLQSSAMQWQKNTGYIYNSTDLGTINSITITKSEGTFTTYYGTSKQPSSSTTVGNGYFQIEVGNATGKTSKVTITFTKTTTGGTTTTYSDYITSCTTETVVCMCQNSHKIGIEQTTYLSLQIFIISICQRSLLRLRRLFCEQGSNQ